MSALCPTLTELQNLAAWLVLCGLAAAVLGAIWAVTGWLREKWR
jgi:hypothetical protein